MSVCDDGTDESLFRFYMKYLKMRLDQNNPGTFTMAAMKNEIHTSTSLEQNDNNGHTVPVRRKRKMSINFTTPLKVIRCYDMVFNSQTSPHKFYTIIPIYE